MARARLLVWQSEIDPTFVYINYIIVVTFGWPGKVLSIQVRLSFRHQLYIVGQLFLTTSSHYMEPGHQYTRKVRELLYERACLHRYHLFIEKKIADLTSDIAVHLNRVPSDSLCTYCGANDHDRCECKILDSYLKQVMVLNKHAADQEPDTIIRLPRLEFSINN